MATMDKVPSASNTNTNVGGAVGIAADDYQHAKERTPYDLLVERVYIWYTQVSAAVDAYCPPIPTFLVSAAAMLVFAVLNIVYFSTSVSNEDLLARTFMGTTTPNPAFEWLYFMEVVFSGLSLLIVCPTFLHKPSWSSKAGKQTVLWLTRAVAVVCATAMFASSAMLLMSDNLGLAIGDPCSSNPTSFPNAAMAGVSTASGCALQTYVLIKKVLMYMNLFVVAGMCHATVTAAVWLHQRVYEAVAQLQAVELARSTDKMTQLKALDGLCGGAHGGGTTTGSRDVVVEKTVAVV